MVTAAVPWLSRYGVVAGASEGFGVVAGVSEGFGVVSGVPEGFGVVSGVPEGFGVVSGVPEGAGVVEARLAGSTKVYFEARTAAFFLVSLIPQRRTRITLPPSPRLTVLREPSFLW